MQKPTEDKRMLPTDEVVAIADKIYVAAFDKDDDALTAACNEWLTLKGKRDGPSLVGFSFRSKTRLLDVEVEVTARINCGGLVAEATAVSGNAPPPTSEQSVQAGAALLIGVEAAIEHATRKLVQLAIYPDADDALGLYDAMRKVAAIKA